MALFLVGRPARTPFWRGSRAKMLRRRSLGVLFLLGVVFLLWLAIAFYAKTFTSVVKVNLQADSIGHQLDVPADVKLRGLIVGEVRGVHTNGSTATINLALEPDKVRLIPANVEARILPKTLFGEKFVDLIMPGDPSSHRLGDPGYRTIGLDHSQTAIEAEKVFDDLVPLLQTLQPVELNMTLSNLADALRGRGNELGDNLSRTDTYFSGLNPDIGNIKTDISGLADLATNLDAATPDLLATARQFSANARTIVEKSDVYANFLRGTRGFADVATNVVTQNENNLVSLAQVSKPNLQLLAKYSPEFPCLLQGLTEAQTPLDQSFQARPGGPPGLHIRLELINEPNGYTYPNDKPDYVLKDSPRFSGPHCYGLPAKPKQPVDAPVPINGRSDNSGGGSSGGSGGSGGGSVPNPGDSSNPAGDIATLLAAPQLGVAGDQVPDLATLLAAPQLAGMQVSVR